MGRQLFTESKHASGVQSSHGGVFLLAQQKATSSQTSFISTLCQEDIYQMHCQTCLISKEILKGNNVAFTSSCVFLLELTQGATEKKVKVWKMV
jgi:hypothetical protein